MEKRLKNLDLSDDQLRKEILKYDTSFSIQDVINLSKNDLKKIIFRF